MPVIVQKYGGTSIGSVEKIKSVANKIIDEKNNGNDIVVVVSAMSGETNRLLKLAKDIDLDATGRELDTLVSTGEQVTTSLLTLSLISKGHKAISLTGSQAGIFTDSSFNKARIESINNTVIDNYLKEGNIVVVAGFQGVNEKGDITTLGRGGSDTSAVAISVALDAKECQIFTDVDGVYTTDPRIVPKAKKLDTISMEGMLELAGQGAKVIQIRAVEFANKFKVPVRVLSSFSSGAGTMITLENETMENAEISGIAFQKDQIKVTFTAVEDTPGIASKILGPLSESDIKVDVIVQNVGIEGKTDFTFTIATDEKDLLDGAIEKIQKSINYKEVIIDDEIAKVSIVGVGIRSHAGVAAKAFQTLSENEINIGMISTSEIKLTLVIEKDDLEKAVKVLHDVFELDK